MQMVVAYVLVDMKAAPDGLHDGADDERIYLVCPTSRFDHHSGCALDRAARLIPLRFCINFYSRLVVSA